MESFIVTYVPSNDIHAQELVSRIASFPCSVKLAEATYLIATDLSAGQVFDRVVMRPNQDQLYVVKACTPFHGEGSRKADEWLQRNLSVPRKLPVTPPDLIR